MIGRFLAWYQPEWLERARIGAPFRLGPTGKLALSIDSSWRSERFFVQLIAKIDEANTHSAAPTMIMGAYIARVGQWNRFDHKWRKELKKANLDHFHAQEMSGHPFVSKAVKISDDTLMAGFVIRLDKKDYDQFYRSGAWGGKAQPDSMYGLCFRFLLAACLEIGLGEYRPNLKLDFIIESGHPNEGAPNEIVRRIKKQNIKGVSEYLGTVTPMLKKDCYGLQAADGLATGAGWIEGPNGSSIPLSNILPAARLADVTPKSPLKAPLFRCHLDQVQLEKLRDETFAFVEFKRQFGLKRNAEIAAKKAKASEDVSAEPLA